MKLAQTQGAGFTLLDNNVSTTQLKNLVTDKPAPITVKLAQTQGAGFTLLDNNVSTTHLKNLVTDKPAPITVKLAQIEKDDKMKNLVTDN
jgi:nitrogen fixation protein